MSSIEHVSMTKVTLNTAECEATRKASADKLADIGEKALSGAQETCQLNTWYSHNAGHGGSGKRAEDYPSEMDLTVAESELGEMVLQFTCAKAICRGDDATTDAAARVESRVNTVVRAVDHLKRL